VAEMRDDEPFLVFPPGGIVDLEAISRDELVRDTDLECAYTGAGHPATMDDSEAEIARWQFWPVGRDEPPTLFAVWHGDNGLVSGTFAVGKFAAILTSDFLRVTMREGEVTGYGTIRRGHRALAFSWPLRETYHVQGNKGGTVLFAENGVLALRDVFFVKPGTWDAPLFGGGKRSRDFVEPLVYAIARVHENDADPDRRRRATEALSAPVPLSGSQPGDIWFCEPYDEYDDEAAT
jgi:hypothetical protein